MNYKKPIEHLIKYAELEEIIKILKISNKNIFLLGVLPDQFCQKNTQIQILI